MFSLGNPIAIMLLVIYAKSRSYFYHKNLFLFLETIVRKGLDKKELVFGLSEFYLSECFIWFPVDKVRL